MTPTSPVTDAQTRQATLGRARDEATTRHRQLVADINAAAAAEHTALTAANFDTAAKHRATADNLQASLPAAAAAVDTLEAALREVSAEAAAAQHRSQRDALADSVAATRLELDELLADAKAALVSARDKLARARFAEEHTFRPLQREHAHLVAQIEGTEPPRYADRERPVTDLLEAHPGIADLVAGLEGLS